MSNSKGQGAQNALHDAVAAHRRGDLDTAENAYRAILRIEPGISMRRIFWEPYARCAGATQMRKRCCAKRLRSFRRLPPRTTISATSPKAQGRPEESLGDYSRAVKRDPKYADAFNNRGNVYLELGRTDEALADYDRALAVQPGHINALQKSARVFAETRRYHEALSCIRADV